jgi:hypothetical protein
MSASDDTKTKLRELRDRLSFELPRARVRSKAPAELVDRLQAALEAVNGAYALPAASTPSAAEALEEARQEAVVEAHLVLHDWERWTEAQRQPKLKAQAPKPRRAVDARQSADVEVRLLRYRAQNGDGREVAFSDPKAAHAARNVSADGIFVTMPKDELPQLGVGGVLQLAAQVDNGAALQARATVVRRDVDGVSLKWIVDNDRTRRLIDALLDGVRRARKER